MSNRYYEAVQLWNWIQWRLPADLWMEAQQILGDTNAPPLTNPQLIAGLAALQDPSTPRAQKLQLLQQLLVIIKDRN